MNTNSSGFMVLLILKKFRILGPQPTKVVIVLKSQLQKQKQLLKQKQKLKLKQRQRILLKQRQKLLRKQKQRIQLRWNQRIWLKRKLKIQLKQKLRFKQRIMNQKLLPQQQSNYKSSLKMRKMSQSQTRSSLKMTLLMNQLMVIQHSLKKTFKVKNLSLVQLWE